MKYFQNFSKFLHKQTIYLKISLLFFGFLLIVQTVGLFSYHINSQRLRTIDPWLPSASNSTVPFLARWDSGYYISIVKWGYSFNQDHNSNVVFFPLYPMLITSFSKLVPINYFYLGEIISWLMLLGSLIFFYKLMRFDYSEKHSFRALFYLLLFPWSFFLAAVYTESLFLFLITASFYYARKQNWPITALFGFFACLARISGVFLFPALLYEYFFQYKKFDTKSAWLFLIPFGLFTFMIYLKLKTGYFLAFLYNQSTYGRKFTFPLITLWIDTKNTVSFLKHGEILMALVYALGLLALLILTILIIKKLKSIRLSYLIFACFAIVLPLCTGTTTSIGRYLATVFPIFIAASLIENKIFQATWLIFCSILLVVFAFSFVGWYFIV